MKRELRAFVSLLMVTLIIVGTGNQIVATEVRGDGFKQNTNITSGPAIELFGIIDIEPPELLSINLNKGEVEVPGTIDVELIGEDEVSGLAHGWLTFKHSTTDKEITLSVSNQIWNDETQENEILSEGTLKGVMEVDQYSYPGNYELERVELRDRAGNNQYYYKDPSESQLGYGYKKLPVNRTITVVNEIFGDKEPPKIVDIKLERNEIEAPGAVEIELIGEDEISGLAHGWLTFKDSVTDQEITLSVSNQIWNDETQKNDFLSEGTLKGIMEVGQYQYPGSYELERVELRDRAGNNQYYYKDPSESQLGYGYKKLPVNRTITVVNETNGDKESPKIVDVKLEKNEIQAPGTVKTELIGEDEISGLAHGWLTFKHSAINQEITLSVSNQIWNDETQKNDFLPEGTLKGIMEVGQYQYPGSYELERVELRDRAGNNQYYYKDPSESQLGYGYKKLPVNRTIMIINDSGEYELITNTANPNLANEIKKILSPAEGEPPVRIGVNYETGSRVPETIFEAISGENKEIVFEGGDIQWVFNGKDIKSENIKPIDLNVGISNLDRFYGGNANEIKEKVADKPTYVLSFPNNGQLPGKAKVRLKADSAFTQHLGREDLSVYYFDRSTGELVSIQRNVNVSFDGFIEFEIDHNSDFLIVNENAISKSNDAALQSLTISSGILTPAFNKDTLDYTVAVKNSVRQVTVAANPMDSNARVEVVGARALEVGANHLTILVTAEDGKTTKEYRVVVNRESSSYSGGSGSSESNSNSSSEAKPKATVVEEVIESLSEKDKALIQNNFKENIPYTNKDGKLTVELLMALTNNQFTQKQIKEILGDERLLGKLGGEDWVLSQALILKPIKNPSFTDIGSYHWAYNAIKDGAELGLVAGMPDGTFAPNSPLQVADTFTFLDRVLLLNGVTEMRLPRSVVEKYITNKQHWAFANMASIASKLNEDTLKVVSELEGKAINRELLAQVLYEITQGKIEPVRDALVFEDIDGSSYKEAINYCTSVGLLSGVSSKHMAPEKVLTRAELISVLTRLNDMLK